MTFKDRAQAGRLLAKKLERYAGTDALVLALPRGGVPVGAEIALALSADLDIVIPRKIPAPSDPELAIGAVSDHGVLLNDDLIRSLSVTRDYMREAVAKERAEIERRSRLYRGSEPVPSIKGRTVIIVDDGVATGYTMLAALRGAKTQEPMRLVAAVPVAPPETVPTLEAEADEVVVLSTPALFFAVGQFYEDFTQVSDEEVQALLARVRRFRNAPKTPPEESP
ncbi:MAG: phosphoribosyltransferase [Firmicutes bacterium]|jgi:putative phosphoribosyl transferase|nr:phosphoribosyltransferase [Bacillota bacterium]MDH7495849.1 phosphoribosyltransferase [Bacillota bacterium]